MMANNKHTIRVVELFAGVGGFRIGLEGASDAFETIWNNQWEPSTVHQDASLVYRARFGSKGHSNQDINLVDEELVPEEFFIPEDEVVKWKYEKGARKIERTSKEGFKYTFSEGGMAFPDYLDRPSRTIITGEGGSAASRFKHVVLTPSGRYRRLIPIELERLNMFPDNHTMHPDVSDGRRAFLMGNALVCGVVQNIGKSPFPFHL